MMRGGRGRDPAATVRLAPASHSLANG